ncbi:EamA family transporter [Geosporobacter ferrireducens]|uniref:O-acetylserine/cysteine exporter n=1 Tax=Geosporobacter ferrireducens TaxID=1424294 RepID=A0A1D8GNS7_9FIRM|nr:EamA family transporter [Geosporobacter ferrireducens]AOT72543.1 O-acetylserine/cysteine exporter [Geosporobacter ferrireducens]MTI54935.1 O-acetylserine/cysteine exporter [Geosporobacter ferrireducens]
MNRRDIGIGLIVVILWGLNFIAIKLGLANMPPLLLAAVRFIVVCLPAIFFLPKPPVAWPWLIALGLTLNVGQFAFLFMGVKLGMPAGLSSLVHQSQAFFTLVIAAALIGERWHWNHVVGLIIAAGGMVVVGSQQGSSMTAAGFWLTLTASASWGAGNVIMRRATQGVPPFSMLSLVVWAGAVAILPLAFLSLCFEGPSAWQAAWHSVNRITILSIIYLAYFASLAGYGLWGKLLSRYPAAMVSPFALLVPVIGMSSAAVFLKETFSLWQMIGALLVMTGLVVNVLGGRQEKSVEKEQV